ncbi:MAG: twin-arginine translocase TatA/TatE family subunit, partial [Ulvibacter sp.]|nr:twin-arginine translocase TatA/TatE family subunit [Ulvibacter sp.]
MEALSFFLVIGWPQIVLIAVVILLLFGGRKIPELMRGLGSGIKEFKDASKEPSEEEDTKIEPKLLRLHLIEPP